MTGQSPGAQERMRGTDPGPSRDDGASGAVRPTAGLNRREAVKRLLRDRGSALVVSGLGSPTYDVHAAGDSAANFSLWGAMGGATMVGLGLALARAERHVLVCTGDGEMLMGLGSLATVAVMAPRNLTIVVLDNGHYAETGMQPSHTSRGVDLAGGARAAGIGAAATITSADELDRFSAVAFSGGRTRFALVRIACDSNPLSTPSLDGAFLRTRFREHLLAGRAQP